MIYVHGSGIRDPLNQFIALELCTKQNKDISMLIENHIYHDQIHQIGNNWLGLIFSFREIFTQKDCFFCFIQVLKVSLRLTPIQKGDLCPARLLPVTAEFSVFIPLQGIAADNCWLEGFLEGYKSIWEINVREMKTNIINKIGKDGWNKLQRLYRCCSSYILSKLFADHELDNLWRRENQDFAEFRCFDWSSDTRSREDRVYTDIKIANSNKSNHIMVCFTDHYNAISIKRHLSKITIQKDSRHLNNFSFCKPNLPSTTNNLLSLLKI